MKDKEQIMIDGVDVSGCENYRPKDRFTCYPYICNCHQKPDCHYKQLARKTSEFEQLQEKYEALKLENQEGYEIVAELKHECEQLKSELYLYKTWYCAKHSDVKNTLGRYHKALKEIEKVCLEDTYTFADGTQIRYDSLDDILDIISKVKEK